METFLKKLKHLSLIETHHKTNMRSNTERELLQQLRHLDLGVWM